MDRTRRTSFDRGGCRWHGTSAYSVGNGLAYLLKPDSKGKVALNGNPTRSSSGFREAAVAEAPA